MGYKNILIRSDSSSSIGTGHIMRDLVLASRYKKSNITFATLNLEANINHIIKNHGFRVVVLDDSSLGSLSAIIKCLEIELLIIDHYDIDSIYEKKLKKMHPQLKIMVVDDTYEKHHCDILLNHNIYADAKKYANKVPKGCELLCGSEYTLLRDEFKTHKKFKIQNSKFKIFVAMGGSDPLGLNEIILNILQNYDIEVDIVSTQANKELESLKNFVARYFNMRLHIETNRVASLMAECDLAVVSASSLLNEVCFMQKPFIAIQTATNQHYMVEFLQTNGYKVMQIFCEKKFKNHLKDCGL